MRRFRSFIVLFLSGIVVTVCGQFFGWWNVPIQGMEHIPSYQARKEKAEMEKKIRWGEVGPDGEPRVSEAFNNTAAQRRSEVLRSGGGIEDLR